MADPGQLGEVLAAVIAGARKSTPRERTRITIGWEVETVAERLSPTALAAGKYARITVRDDGHGFDAEQAASVFDPVLSKTGDPASAAAALGSGARLQHRSSVGRRHRFLERARPRFDIRDLLAVR